MQKSWRCHRCRSSVNFGGEDIFAWKYMYEKNFKNDQILHDNCPKNIFPNFWGQLPSYHPSPSLWTLSSPGVFRGPCYWPPVKLSKKFTQSQPIFSVNNVCTLLKKYIWNMKSIPCPPPFDISKYATAVVRNCSNTDVTVHKMNALSLHNTM